MNPPGLIKRELIEDHGDSVTIRETWDLTVPGCPLVAIRLDNGGRGIHAISYERNVRMTRQEWLYGVEQRGRSHADNDLG